MSKVKRVTMRDVAKASGVSIYTVSSVLNGKGDIGLATTRKVRDAMRRLHYNPLGSSPLAKRIATKSIGLVVPNVYCEMNPFYFRAIVAGKEFSRRGSFDFKLFSEDEMYETVERDGVMDLQFGCQGLIVFCPQAGWETYVDQLADEGVPVAVVRRPCSRRGVISLMDSDASGMGLMLDHLYRLGHRQIAGVGLRLGSSEGGRLGAYRNFCRERQLPELIIGPQSMGELDQYLADALKSDPPTALACWDDQIASHVLRVLRRLGCCVPEDVAVTGYNNDSTATGVDPCLTTVNVPVEEMVQAACELLLTFDSRKALATEVSFENNLIVRESCGSNLGGSGQNANQKTATVAN